MPMSENAAAMALIAAVLFDGQEHEVARQVQVIDG